MKRSELEHVLRAPAAIAQKNSFVVVESKAILNAFPHAPEELRVSPEIDLYPCWHLERADLIDGAIGAMCSFDQTFGYDADGVGHDSAAMPSDWLDLAKYPVPHITQWTERRARGAAP